MAKSKSTKSAGSGSKKAAKPRFNQKFLDEMRRKLLKERAKYLHSAEEYQAEAESLLATREPGDVQFDEEGGEGTTVAVERERDLALSSQARHTVSQIDAALERIENGTYGYCITSGAPIPIARLRAIPWAAERVEVKAGGLGRR
ncbi:MAG: TraR/DksA family transcriptional regulator [Acidimicrobiaceae bacterium]|nr:TraR/DksA family transcriptional regulator [Acidimicrobiaceae bacterium]MXW99048.1 TraR/DksA family transcriptional regulator [Acidimicrobiaceae bacterium]